VEVGAPSSYSFHACSQMRFWEDEKSSPSPTFSCLNQMIDDPLADLSPFSLSSSPTQAVFSKCMRTWELFFLPYSLQARVQRNTAHVPPPFSLSPCRLVMTLFRVKVKSALPPLFFFQVSQRLLFFLPLLFSLAAF